MPNPTAADALKIFRLAAWQCARIMGESSAFIQDKLPTTDRRGLLRTSVDELCRRLDGSEYDINSELSELRDISGVAGSEDRVRLLARRIGNWLQDDMTEIHRVVTLLEEATHRESRVELSHILVAESAVNIFNAFADTRRALDAFDASSGNERRHETPG